MRFSSGSLGSAAGVGTALAAGSAFSYGVTVVIGRTLAEAELAPSLALGFRFAIAAAALVVVLAAWGRPFVPAPGERLRALLLGVVGYAVQSSLFYMGLERGTAGAVALLFYAYPAMVLLAEAALGRDHPGGRGFAALGLSAAGTALVVIAGGDVTISFAGAVFSLLAAAAFGVYLLSGHALIERTDAMTTAAWVAGGAAVSLLIKSAVEGSLSVPGDRWDAMLGYGLATAAAFTLMFAALRRLGPSRTGVALTLEALFAIILAGIFLDETLRPLQLVGGAAILAATVLIAVSRPTPVEV